MRSTDRGRYFIQVLVPHLTKSSPTGNLRSLESSLRHQVSKANGSLLLETGISAKEGNCQGWMLRESHIKWWYQNIKHHHNNTFTAMYWSCTINLQSPFRAPPTVKVCTALQNCACALAFWASNQSDGARVNDFCLPNKMPKNAESGYVATSVHKYAGSYFMMCCVYCIPSSAF